MKGVIPFIAAAAARAFAKVAQQVVAQSAKLAGTTRNAPQCLANAEWTDKDGDAHLDELEIQTSRRVAPTLLGDENAISKGDFLRECNAIGSIP